MRISLPRPSRTLAVLALVLAFAAASAAQSPAPPAAPRLPPKAGAAADEEAGPALLRKLALDPKELDQIEKVLDKDEDALAKARAEIRVIQARLARLLLEQDVPMDQVQALVKESLDWEYKVRMIQIGRQIDLRRILGDGRWSSLFKLGRALPAIEGAGNPGQPQADRKELDRRERLLKIIKRLN